MVSVKNIRFGTELFIKSFYIKTKGLWKINRVLPKSTFFLKLKTLKWSKVKLHGCAMRTGSGITSLPALLIFPFLSDFPLSKLPLCIFSIAMSIHSITISNVIFYIFIFLVLNIYWTVTPAVAIWSRYEIWDYILNYTPA